MLFRRPAGCLPPVYRFSRQVLPPAVAGLVLPLVDSFRPEVVPFLTDSVIAGR